MRSGYEETCNVWTQKASAVEGMASYSASNLGESTALRIEGASTAVVAGNLVGNFSLYVLPLLGGAICRRFQITDDVFGYVMSAQLAGMGISPFIVASLPTTPSSDGSWAS